jgi:hypothetical protein
MKSRAIEELQHQPHRHARASPVHVILSTYVYQKTSCCSSTIARALAESPIRLAMASTPACTNQETPSANSTSVLKSTILIETTDNIRLFISSHCNASTKLAFADAATVSLDTLVDLVRD